MRKKNRSGQNLRIIGQAQKDYFWNSLAGLLNAAEAVLMSMIITRLTGLTDAGILTIAFAIGNLMMSVGKFGVRNFQVTDTEDRFSFAVYLKTRAVTVFSMIVFTVIYLIYAVVRLDYSQDKICIIFFICMIYAVEALEDVIWGYYQHRGRLDAGAEIFCYRWIGILSSFAVVLYISRNLAFTLTVCFLFSILLFVIQVWRSYGHICAEQDRSIFLLLSEVSWESVGSLLKAVFPLFGISFFSFYENNASKYAIDACLTDTKQACYGFVAMPVFVIGLLNNFIYQPMLVVMADEWRQMEYARFKKRIGRQMFIIGGISIICILGAYLFGIPVLSLLYDTDLTAYKSELMILLCSSAFLAASGYLSVVLTIMRCQKSLLWPHCIVSIIAIIVLEHIVEKYQTMGAAYGYLGLMILLCIFYGIILVFKMRAVDGDGNESGHPGRRYKKYDQQ